MQYHKQKSNPFVGQYDRKNKKNAAPYYMTMGRQKE
jgi:hypothetical protein